MKILKLLIKAKMISRIIKNRHIILLTLDRNNLIKQLQGEDYEPCILYCGLQKYNVMKVLSDAEIDESELILERVKFVAEAEIKLKTNLD